MKTNSHQSPKFKTGDIIKFHIPREDETFDIGVLNGGIPFPANMDDFAWNVYFFEMEKELAIFEHEMILVSRIEDGQKEKDQRT